MATTPNYYSNPAFCQQSEFNNGQRPPGALSPQGSIRHSPVGAQTIHRVLDSSVCEGRENPALEEEGVEEQEFYEEVVVDDKGFIKEKKFVIVAQNNEGRKYIQVPQGEERHGSRYGIPQQVRYDSPKNIEKPSRSQSKRYEYIPMQEHDNRYSTPKQSPKKQEQHEEIEVASARVHRYAVVTERETELANNSRYALVPVEMLTSVIPPQAQNKHRYEYIPDPPRPTACQNTSRYEYIRTSPSKPPLSANRYEYPQQTRVGNPIATQKLHELLSTPKKSPQKASCPHPGRMAPPPVSPIPKETFQAQAKVQKTPKAQQKLNYALGTRQLAQQDKRHTAIVAPMCSSPNHSVYSETTYSRSESWMNLSVSKAPVQATLAVAAILMLLCGGITSGLCFYMISVMGRLYYLDFGIVSGFTCLILGLLGFRTRGVYWLPNRNYISGKKMLR